MKIYLCGITQNEEIQIDELTKDIWQNLDGLIFVDGGSKDKTCDILNQRKKNGSVIYRKWTNDHDFQMNEFLRCGIMEPGDWFILRDSSERIGLELSNQIHNICNTFSSQNIKTVVQASKICLAEYNEDMFFLGTPHWGLHNAQNNYVDILGNTDFPFKDILNKNLYSNRYRTDKEWILHDIKYYYVYDRSNHVLLYYKDRESFFNQETLRKTLRIVCKKVLNLDFTINSLEKYLKENYNNLHHIIKLGINNNRLLNNFYKMVVLNIDPSEIRKDIMDLEVWVSDFKMIKI